MGAQQIYKFSILLESGADLIIEIQKITNVFRISAFSELIIRFKLARDGFNFAEFINIILVRIAQPKVCADGVFVLVVLCRAVSVFFQKYR